MINTIESKITNIINKNERIYNKRMESIEAAYKETNEMIPPNKDNLGRFHAPCNGYRIPQVQLDNCDFTDCYEDRLFQKGSFLPNPIEDEFVWFNNNCYNKFKMKSRILIQNETIEKLKEIDFKEKPFMLGFGNTWSKGDNIFCYLYVSSDWKSIITLFKETIKKLENKKAKVAKSNKGVGLEGEKIEVIAKVINIKLKEDYYGNEVLKLMLEFENGSTAFGSLPKKIKDVVIGQFISFKASFSHDKNDNTHSYYKSPSLSKILDIKSFK